MSVQEVLIITAFGVLVLLAVSRVVRVRSGRSVHPEGRARLLFLLALLFLPAIIVEVVLLRPVTSAAQLHIVESELVYLAALAVFSLLMGIAALVAQLAVHGRLRPLLLLALVGSEPDPNDVPFDPALTPELAESVAEVDQANAVFPRGPEFAAQIDRPGFRSDWDALETATEALEGRIADDQRLGVAVASSAKAAALDARGRLDTLRRLAGEEGQAWAA